MPNIGEMKPSKFLKKDHIGAGKVFTVKGVSQRNVAQDDQPEDNKWCLEFEEFDKPMVLGSETLDQAASILGSQNTDDWAGKQVEVWVNPDIRFAGQKVGGLRLRAVRH